MSSYQDLFLCANGKHKLLIFRQIICFSGIENQEVCLEDAMYQRRVSMDFGTHAEKLPSD